ncbi:MAG: M1 family aminopeptidase [Bradymonadia bacterium]
MPTGHESPTPVTPHSFDEPAARPARRRPIPLKPLHVRLHVQIDPERPVVEGEVHHTVEILGDDVTRVPIDATDLVVHTVKLLTPGQPAVDLSHSPYEGGVMITLDTPRQHGETIMLSLRYTAWPTAGLYFVGPDSHAPERRVQAWTQGAMEDHHRWFPCFDAPEHMVTSEIIADVPEAYAARANGVPVTPAASEGALQCPEGYGRWHWRHDTRHALYLMTLVIDDSVEVTDQAGEISLHHYVPAGREADAQAIFSRMGEMLSFFAESTGTAYPYPRYGHTFLQEFMWGGMENTTLTSLTDLVLVEGRHHREEDVERLVAHELAHQWFGDLIAPRGWTEIWLNESFATYFEQLCMQALEGDDDFYRRMQSERDSYLSEARERYARPVVSRRYADPYVLFDRHAYEKGCLVLHTLRDQIGDRAFFRGVQTYVSRMAGRAAETCDLRRAFEEVTGADLHPFFESWVYGAGHPQISVKWSWRADGGLLLETTRTDEGAHALTLTVQAWADGALKTWRIHAGSGGVTSLPLSTPPSWVAFDPHQACLVEIDESGEADGALAARLMGPNYVAIDATPGGEGTGPVPLRIRTVRALGKRGRPQNTRVLAQVLCNDPSPAVRREAARALGAHQSIMARRALRQVISAEAEPEWRVRAAAVRALGVGSEPGQIDVLADVLRSEESHRVRCAALGALGEIKTEEARAVIRLYLDAASPRHCIAAAAVQALSAHEVAEVFDEIALRLQPGHPRSIRQVATGALAQLGRKGSTELKEKVRQTLEHYLTDGTFAVRLLTVKALARLGDANAKSALERAHGAESSALVRRYIRESLGQLSAS